MTIWDWMFVFYAAICIGLLAATWLWKPRIEKPRAYEDKPCECLHPIKCDLFDKCMRNEK